MATDSSPAEEKHQKTRDKSRSRKHRTKGKMSCFKIQTNQTDRKGGNRRKRRRKSQKSPVSTARVARRRDRTKQDSTRKNSCRTSRRLYSFSLPHLACPRPAAERFAIVLFCSGPRMKSRCRRVVMGPELENRDSDKEIGGS